MFKDSYLCYEPDVKNKIYFDEIFISDFSEIQINKYIKSFKKEITEKGVTIEEFIEVINETHDLSDLARRPVLLSIIVQTLPQIISDIRTNKKKVKKINAANLYDNYTKRWLEREDLKGKTLIYTKEKLLFCKNMAYKMFLDDIEKIHFTHLPNEIKKYFLKLTAIDEIDYFSHDIQSYSYLNSDGEGNFSFIHKSFMEYFVANVILEKLSNINIRKKKDLIVGELEKYIGNNVISTEIGLFIDACSKNISDLLKNSIDSVNSTAADMVIFYFN